MSNSREFPTGSRRDNNVDEAGQPTKPRYDLISPHFLSRLAWHLARGAAKYGERNWEKGQPKAVIIESLLRHVAAVHEGRTDEDHISAAAFGLMALAHFEKVGWPAELVEDAELVEEDEVVQIGISIEVDTEEAFAEHLTSIDKEKQGGQHIRVSSIPLRAFLTVFDKTDLGLTATRAAAAMRICDSWQFRRPEAEGILDALEEVGFLEYDERTQLFHVTRSGYVALEALND